MTDICTINLNSETPFNLDITLSCGQAPRWEYSDGWWTGVVTENVIKIRQKQNIIEYIGCNEKFIFNYFCLDYDLNEFYKKFRGDYLLKNSFEKLRGLRIINQDPWECLLFQMTVNKIRTRGDDDRITRIAKGIGKEITFEGRKYYSVPRPEIISESGLRILKTCNIGYYATNIFNTAEKIIEDKNWADKVSAMNYEEAVAYLSEFKGVKRSVAEWVLLLSLKRYDIFPVDTHIRDFFIKNYMKDYHFSKTGSSAINSTIRDVAGKKFGSYAGYAMEYLFNINNEFIKDYVKP
ncbi:DNA-3-methyladenine glycosylase family protein [Methanoplanus limicola]|uniref:8-oxoguanine DNA glycosylase domain-containing protein n=1 Tax=Methanoplanus limicola DSM 2279 TaxID=937775 RepID=H1Z473_9EURY|nr:DNA glycosylase [Methanoplanus limicola]EHQ35752.1 8-oxoguanine DNA glycosylase domain-containing protein [Methanoplanus limicola DSM 2279]